MTSTTTSSTLDDITINPAELVQFSVQLNTGGLLNIINQLVSTVKQHEHTITQLRSNLSALRDRVHFEVGEKPGYSLQQRVWQQERHIAESIEKKLLELEVTHTRDHTDVMKKTSDNTSRISILEIAASTSHERISNEMQDIRDTTAANLSTARTQLEDKIAQTRDKCLYETKCVKEDLSQKLDAAHNESRYRLNVAFDRLEQQSQSTQQLYGKSLDAIASFKETALQTTQEQDKKMSIIKDAVKLESQRTNMIFEMLRIDDHVVRQLREESYKPTSKTLETLRENQSVLEYTAKGAILLPETDKEALLKRPSTGPKGTPTEMIEQSNGHVHPELDRVWTQILLETPYMKTLKSALRKELHETFQQAQDERQQRASKSDGQYKTLIDEMKKKVSKDEFNKFLEDHDDVRILKQLSEKNASDLEYIRVYYTSRDQALAWLKTKADLQKLDMKADRKFVDSLFDFVNEKLNALLGEKTTDDVMKAIKRIEDQITHQQELMAIQMQKIETTRTLAKESMANAQMAGSSSTGVGSAATPGSAEATDTSAFVNGKCLSCNRPAPEYYRSSGISLGQQQRLVGEPEPETPMLRIRPMTPGSQGFNTMMISENDLNESLNDLNGNGSVSPDRGRMSPHAAAQLAKLTFRLPNASVPIPPSALITRRSRSVSGFRSAREDSRPQSRSPPKGQRMPLTYRPSTSSALSRQGLMLPQIVNLNSQVMHQIQEEFGLGSSEDHYHGPSNQAMLLDSEAEITESF